MNIAFVDFLILYTLFIRAQYPHNAQYPQCRHVFIVVTVTVNVDTVLFYFSSFGYYYYYWWCCCCCVSFGVCFILYIFYTAGDNACINIDWFIYNVNSIHSCNARSAAAAADAKYEKRVHFIFGLLMMSETNVGDDTLQWYHTMPTMLLCFSVSISLSLFALCTVPWMLECVRWQSLWYLFSTYFYAYNKRQMIVLVWWWLLLLRSSWYKAFALNEREIHISNANQNEMHLNLFCSDLKQASKQKNEKTSGASVCAMCALKFSCALRFS